MFTLNYSPCSRILSASIHQPASLKCTVYLSQQRDQLSDMARPKSKGCNNCKRLKIKCNLARPLCEYCVYTNKTCDYTINENSPVRSNVFIMHSNNKVKKPRRKPKPIVSEVTTVITPPKTPISTAPTTPSRSSSPISIQSLLLDPLVGHLVSDEVFDVVSPRIISTPNTPAVCSLNNTSKLMGISPFEFMILHHFESWAKDRYIMSTDVRQRFIWEWVMPRYLLELDVLKISVFAYSSMLLLQKHNPQYLLGDTPCWSSFNDEMMTLYEFAFTNFESQMKQINRLSSKIKAGEPINILEAISLVIGATIMISVFGRHSRRTMPLISFDRSQQDFQSLCAEMKQILTLCWPILRKEPHAALVPSLVKNIDYPILPMFQQLLDELDTLPSELFKGKKDNIDADNKVGLRDAILTLNAQVQQCEEYSSEVPIHRFQHFAEESFWRQVYNENYFALRILNLYCAYLVMLQYYFVRERNMWIDYMNWFHQESLFRFGKFYYDEDEKLYEKVIVNGYTAGFLNLWKLNMD